MEKSCTIYATYRNKVQFWWRWSVRINKLPAKQQKTDTALKTGKNYYICI